MVKYLNTCTISMAWYPCCLVSRQIRQWLAQAHNAFGHDDHFVNVESSSSLKGARNSCEERMSFESLTGERASVLLEDLEDGVIFRRCQMSVEHYIWGSCQLIRGTHAAGYVALVLARIRCFPSACGNLYSSIGMGYRPKIHPFLLAAAKEIAWKAWYAGPNSLDHLLATPQEHGRPHQVAGCPFYVGATPPGNSRTGQDNRDAMFGYHWHMAYVIQLEVDSVG